MKLPGSMKLPGGMRFDRMDCSYNTFLVT
jgi:hypothetical protein